MHMSVRYAETITGKKQQDEHDNSDNALSGNGALYSKGCDDASIEGTAIWQSGEFAQFQR